MADGLTPEGESWKRAYHKMILRGRRVVDHEKLQEVIADLKNNDQVPVTRRELRDILETVLGGDSAAT